MSTEQSFFEKVSFMVSSIEHNFYQLFGFEWMHVFDLVTFEELKDCPFHRLGSDNLVLQRPEGTERTYRFYRKAILRACNEILKGA